MRRIFGAVLLAGWGKCAGKDELSRLGVGGAGSQSQATQCHTLGFLTYSLCASSARSVQCDKAISKRAIDKPPARTMGGGADQSSVSVDPIDDAWIYT